MNKQVSVRTNPWDSQWQQINLDPVQIKIGSGMNKNLLIFNSLRFRGKGRIHIVHKELCGSLLENSRAVSQQGKDNAKAPTRQRHSQCVVSDLASFTT